MIHLYQNYKNHYDTFLSANKTLDQEKWTLSSTTFMNRNFILVFMLLLSVSTLSTTDSKFQSVEELSLHQVVHSNNVFEFFIQCLNQNYFNVDLLNTNKLNTILIIKSLRLRLRAFTWLLSPSHSWFTMTILVALVIFLKIFEGLKIDEIFYRTKNLFNPS
jgi:hypothetical protein